MVEIIFQNKKDWRAQSRKLVINHEVHKFTKVLRQNLATLLISSFGVAAALSWNDAIRTFIDSMFPEKTILYKFYSAIIVSIICVIATYFISRLKE